MFVKFQISLSVKTENIQYARDMYRKIFCILLSIRYLIEYLDPNTWVRQNTANLGICQTLFWAFGFAIMQSQF